ncbi:hypothetical protein [Bacillus mycoides]
MSSLVSFVTLLKKVKS